MTHTIDTYAPGHLFGAYFDQDRDLEGANDQDTIRVYKRSNPDRDGQLRLAESLLALANDHPEAELPKMLDALGCAWDPPAGMTVRRWLHELADLLTSDS